jgi:Ca2+-binding RTX toxin-like protein
MAVYNGTSNTDLFTGTSDADFYYNIGVGLDLVLSGSGDDRVEYRPGTALVVDLLPDVVEMGLGVDTLALDFSGYATRVTMALPVLNGAVGLSSAVNLEGGLGLTYTGVNRFEATGGNGDDQLFGGTLNDVLAGGAGIDAITSGDGNDVVRGGLGADMLAAGAGTDLLDYTGSSAGVWVDLGVGAGRFGDAQGDAFNGFENVLGSSRADALIGDQQANLIDGAGGNDSLVGGGGNDMLRGSAGDDTLVSGLGADVFDGGSGADTFVFLAAGDSPVVGRDVIIDFSGAAGDRLDFSAIDASGARSGDEAFSFIGNDAFSGTGGELRVSYRTDFAVISGDVNGDGFSDFDVRIGSARVILEEHIIL